MSAAQVEGNSNVVLWTHKLPNKHSSYQFV